MDFVSVAGPVAAMLARCTDVLFSACSVLGKLGFLLRKYALFSGDFPVVSALHAVLYELPGLI